MEPTMTQLENGFKMLQVALQMAGFSKEEAVKIAGESLKNGDFQRMATEAMKQL